MQNRESLRRLTEAFHLAAEAHVGQRRKGRAREPYINHVADVAHRLMESPEADETTLLAAILHDAVEDTEVGPDEIARRFGAEVAALVAEVTDDKSVPKAERKRRQVRDAPTKPAGARRIKLADKASNLSALVRSPPEDWSAERLGAYLAWAREVVDRLRGVDPTLEASFDREAARAEAALSTASGGSDERSR